MDLTEAYLKKYLEAIDAQAQKEKSVLNIQIHNGYRKTIKRFLESNSVTTAELLSILSLYSIDDIDPMDIVEYNEVFISFVPQPGVSLSGVNPTIRISFVPSPWVSLSGIVPKISSVPQPEAKITGVLPKLSHVPHPYLKLYNVNPIITFIPHPFVKLSNINTTVYFGVKGSIPTDLSGLETHTAKSYIDFSLDYEPSFGYVCFAMLSTLPVPTKYYMNEFNQGNISDIFSETLVEHNGVQFRLFVSRERTKFEKSIRITKQ